MGDPPQVILAPNQKTAPARVGVLRSQAPLTIAFGMKPAEPQKPASATQRRGSHSGIRSGR
jgi:hypothetical protein